MRAAERKAARLRGEKTYFTGKPCPKGHIAMRYTGHGGCIQCIKDSKEKDRKENPERARERNREWRKRNVNRVRENERRRRDKNIEKIRESLKKWRKKNPRYSQKRRQQNIQVRIADGLRNRFRSALKIGAKTGSAVRDLGCSIEELKVWLENQFKPGMSWGNYGEWHIDHKRPLAGFDLTKREHVLEACNWRNLQPLWAKDNLSKGSKT